MTKPKICFVPGPIHLFWTTGIYLCWEFKDNYDIILVLGTDYRNNKQFNKISHLFHAIHYLDENQKNLFLLHRHFYCLAKTIITKYKPKFVFQHNHVYPFNIYLFNMSKRIGAIKISFQIGFQHDDPKAEHSILKSRRINLMHQNSRLKLPMWLVFIRVTLREFISYYKNYYLMPILITSKPLLTPWDPYTHSIKKGLRRHQHYDLRLVYSDWDAFKTKKENANNILSIRNPVLDNYINVQNMLYENLERNKKCIIILPDGAISDYMLINGKYNVDDFIKLLSDTWNEVVKILRLKFAGFEIGIKLHPSQKSDKILESVLINLKQEYPALRIHKPEKDATRLIIESKVIVAESSTVLWLAKNFEKEKLLISLNLFDLPLANAYSNDQGIFYFESLEKFEKYNFGMTNLLQENNIKTNTLKSLLVQFENEGVSCVLESILQDKNISY